MNPTYQKTTVNFPFYAKAALVCLGLYAFFSILSITSSIIVPLIYATLAAILVSPVVNFLVRKGFNRLLAIAVTVVLMLGLGILMLVLLSNQIFRFAEAIPVLGQKFQELLNTGATWVSENFNVRPETVQSWVAERKTEVVESAGDDMGRKLMSTGSAMIVVILIPIYIFMILYYKPLLIRFIHKLFTADSHDDVDEVIEKTKKIIQTYLVGLIFEAIIVAVMYSIALLSLGIEYAILLALIGALLNLIPYIGSIIAASLPMIIALTTKPPSYAFFVLGAYILIQLIDNNFIIPKIVASRVRVNALVSIIVVICGGTLWGIPGMFIAIPITAILKVIFDHMSTMRPLGYLLGDSVASVPHEQAKTVRVKRRKPRKKFQMKPSVTKNQEPNKSTQKPRGGKKSDIKNDPL